MTVKLSICIATYNRAQLLRQTLESIVPQLTDECEIIVSDNASTDETEQVVSEYANRVSRLTYHRQEVNRGLDRNFDSAVEHATGEYCWLFADDDIFKPDAVATMLEALRIDFSLVLVNWECRDHAMAQVLIPQLFPGLNHDQVYAPDQIDELFAKFDSFVFIGCIVMKRSLWLSRERSRYYGSLIVHLGVIFQDRLPGDTLIVAKVCVSFRENYKKTFLGSELFEAKFVKWPAVIATLAVSEEAKRKKIATMPNASRLLLYRAVNLYSLAEYRRCLAPRNLPRPKKMLFALIAAVPATLLNTVLLILYGQLSREHTKNGLARWLRNSDANVLNRWPSLKFGRDRDGSTSVQ